MNEKTLTWCPGCKQMQPSDGFEAVRGARECGQCRRGAGKVTGDEKKPFASRAEYEAAVHAFWDGVLELREQYQIADVYLVVADHVRGETTCMSSMQQCDSDGALAMLAFALRALDEEMRR